MIKIQISEDQKKGLLEQTFHMEKARDRSLCNSINLEFDKILLKYQSKSKYKLSKKAREVAVKFGNDKEIQIIKLCNEMNVTPSQLLRVELYLQKLGR